jgi:hypothetical protein
MTDEEREMLLEMPAVRELLREEREACASIAESQPYYPDTHTGTRQQWVKDRIAEAIRARS